MNNQPAPGPNYQQYGNVQGYVYNPWDDQYYRDPKAYREYQNQVNPQPKKPGIADQLLPVAAGAAAMQAGQYVGSSVIPGIVSAGSDAVGGLLGLGGGQTAGQVANVGTTAATTATQSTGGLLGLGAPESLGMGQQVSNLASGNLPNAVGTAVDGGTMLADGSVAAADSFGSQAASYLPYAGAVLGAYGLYDLGTRWGEGDRSVGGAGMSALQGAASGAAVGSVIPGVGSLVGGIVGGIYGLTASLVKNGKHEDQVKRDGMRDHLNGLGVVEMIDGSHHITLPDGSKYDIGKDGIEEGVMGKAYNIDLTDATSRKVAGWLQPLTTIALGANPKENFLPAHLTGYLANAAKTQKSPEETVKYFYQQFGLDKDTAFNALSSMAQQGQLDQETHLALNDALNQIYDPNYDFGETPWWEVEVEIPEYAKTIDGKEHPLAGKTSGVPISEATGESEEVQQ